MSDLPEPPFYAVIFTSAHSGTDADGYQQMAARMEELCRDQPGFLGLRNARNPDGEGITVCYWKTRESVEAWRRNAEHLEAQTLGKDKWYDRYALQVARVEKSYTGP